MGFCCCLFKLSRHPILGSSSQPQDQELYALPTKPATCPKPGLNLKGEWPQHRKGGYRYLPPDGGKGERSSGCGAADILVKITCWDTGPLRSSETENQIIIPSPTPYQQVSSANNNSGLQLGKLWETGSLRGTVSWEDPKPKVETWTKSPEESAVSGVHNNNKPHR